MTTRRDWLHAAAALGVASAISPALPAESTSDSIESQTFDYAAPSVGRRMRCTVLLPRNYHGSRLHYPVLYLLHGHTGNHRSWLTYAQLPPDAASRLATIVVLVDGGNTFYVNWHGATDGRPKAWADTVIRDLLPAIEHGSKHRLAVFGKHSLAANYLRLTMRKNVLGFPPSECVM